MNRTKRTYVLVAAVLAGLATAGAPGASAQLIDSQSADALGPGSSGSLQALGSVQPPARGPVVHPVRDGHTITLEPFDLRAQGVAPLDGNPFSRQAALFSDVHAAVAGIRNDESVQATVEVGYLVGYPLAVAPEGIKVTTKTPTLKLTGGLNAKLAPDVKIDIKAAPPGGSASVKLGELGGDAKAEASIIPETSAEYTVAAGGIQTVSLAQFAMTRPSADITLAGVHMSVSNALGPVTVHPYAIITVTTDTGVYSFTEYGAPAQL